MADKVRIFAFLDFKRGGVGGALISGGSAGGRTGAAGRGGWGGRDFRTGHDGWNFRCGPPTPQARKNSKIYDDFSTPLPLIIQNLQFLWISINDFWKFREILWNFHQNLLEKRRIWVPKVGKCANFDEKSWKNWWNFVEFLSMERCKRIDIL